MGKSLIIKGADFSENGMRVTEVTLDKSALYSFSGTLITDENFNTLPNAEHWFYYNRYDINKIASANNNNNRFYCNNFNVEDYTHLEVYMNTVSGLVIPNTGCVFGIAFTNSSGNVIEAYIDSASEQTGEIYKKVSSPFNTTIIIPEGATKVYIMDNINNSSAYSSHKVILKKYSLE